MSIRTEVYQEIKAQIQRGEAIIISESDTQAAVLELEEAKKRYDELRKKVLKPKLAIEFGVVIFGSSRVERDEEEYNFALELGRSLVEARDIAVITGGGPGIMEAALKGAKLGRAAAITKGEARLAKNHGITIKLPNQEDPNDYLDLEAQHQEFPARGQSFLDRTDGTYLAKGGIGTGYELLLVAQALQVHQLEDEYQIVADPSWQGMVEEANRVMFHNRRKMGLRPFIDKKDLNLVTFTNKIPEIVDIFSKSYDSWETNIRRYIKVVS